MYVCSLLDHHPRNPDFVVRDTSGLEDLYTAPALLDSPSTGSHPVGAPVLPHTRALRCGCIRGGRLFDDRSLYGCTCRTEAALKLGKT